MLALEPLNLVARVLVGNLFQDKVILIRMARSGQAERVMTEW